MLLRGNTFYAPSGSAAEAADPGEITDDEVFAAGVETEATDTQTPEPAAEPETPTKSWKDYGLDENPETVHRQLTQLREQAQRGQTYEQKAQAYEQMLWQQLQRQQPQTPAQEQPKPKYPWGEAPEFKREWIDLVMRDENGNLVAKPGAMPDLPQKITAYAKWKEEAQDQFLRDPLSAIKDHISPLVQEQSRQIAEQMFRDYEERRQLADYEAQNRDIYYTDGQLNDLGKYWSQVYQQAKQVGHPNPIGVAHDAADAALFRIQIAQQAAAPQLTPAQQNAEKKDALLKKQANGANRIANRTGTFPKNNGHRDPPQDRKQAWRQAEKAIADLGNDAITFGED